MLYFKSNSYFYTRKCFFTSHAVQFPLSSREIYIYDHEYFNKATQNKIFDRSFLLHPQSDHVISKYASYHHRNKKYNYNDLGEFILTFRAVHPFKLDMHIKSKHNDIADGLISKLHDILILPEGLWIRNLEENQIPLIVDKLMNPQLKFIIGAHDLKRHNYLSDMDKHTIIASYSASEALTLFNEEFNKINCFSDHLITYSLLYSLEIGTPFVEILPEKTIYNRTHSWSADSIELIVKRIVNK